jgi:GTP pyrophosphokinase
MVIKRFVEQIYAGRKRKNGEPVTAHLFGVREILVAEGVTEHTLLEAALLHDILEDTDLTPEYLALRFGEKTAKLIDMLSKNPCWNTSYCKMKSSMDEIEVSWLDYPEAMAIKMADRLHNLYTIDGFKKEKQQEYLEETIELLIPVFERTLKKNNLGYLKNVIFSLLKKLRDESLAIYQRLYSKITI